MPTAEREPISLHQLRLRWGHLLDELEGGKEYEVQRHGNPIMHLLTRDTYFRYCAAMGEDPAAFERIESPGRSLTGTPEQIDWETITADRVLLDSTYCRSELRAISSLVGLRGMHVGVIRSRWNIAVMVPKSWFDQAENTLEVRKSTPKRK